MTYLFIDEWGNIYYSTELNETAKQQINDGILSAIKINAYLKHSDISANNPDDDNEWDEIMEYNESSANQLADEDYDEFDDEIVDNLLNNLEEE